MEVVDLWDSFLNPHMYIYIWENKKHTTDIITNEELLVANENILQDLVIYLIFFLPLSWYIYSLVQLQNLLNFEGYKFE